MGRELWRSVEHAMVAVHANHRIDVTHVVSSKNWNFMMI